MKILQMFYKTYILIFFSKQNYTCDIIISKVAYIASTLTKLGDVEADVDTGVLFSQKDKQ